MKVTVRRRIVVNGKEYAGVDDLPPELRQAYEKAVGSAESASAGAAPEARARIVFNGKQYTCVDEMPEAVRRLYRDAMELAEADPGASASVPGAQVFSNEPGEAFSPAPISPGSGWMSLGSSGGDRRDCPGPSRAPLRDFAGERTLSFHRAGSHRSGQEDAMRSWTLGRIGGLCTVLAACVFLAAAPRHPRAEEKPIVSCAFSNPAYAGLCQEKAPVGQNQTPEQACQGILACLNDSRCLQSYCNATTVRGGWKLASATADAPKKEK